MAKLPNGCTIEKVKDSRGKILAYELRQGDRVWREPTEAQALAAREADIQRMCEESDSPIVLASPTDDPNEIAMIGVRTFGMWRYGFVRKPSEATKDKSLDCPGSCGEYKTRAECERAMRGHAAQLAVRIGPYTEGCEVLADGLNYLVHTIGRRVNPASDYCDQLLHVAYVRAHAMATAKGLEDGSPNSPASQFADDARGQEYRRIKDVFITLRDSPTYRYAVAESFRHGRLVEAPIYGSR